MSLNYKYKASSLLRRQIDDDNSFDHFVFKRKTIYDTYSRFYGEIEVSFLGKSIRNGLAIDSFCKTHPNTLALTGLSKFALKAAVTTHVITEINTTLDW